MNASEQITKWVNEYTEDLYRWAYSKLSNAELARDYIQDTFLIAAEKFSSFEGKSSPKTWLISILNHKIMDHYRKKMKQPVEQSQDLIERYFTSDGEWVSESKPNRWNTHDDEGHLLDDTEFLTVFKICMDDLPETWQAGVRLKYLLSKKGDEICQELDLSPSNYWQIIHRAKLKLRECLENNWFKANS